jgi:hypothetical protein
MKKRRFTKNGVEYWIDDNHFLMGGKKCEPIIRDENVEPTEDRFKHFKDLVNNKFTDNSIMMWEINMSVTAHEYYDYYIQEHQDLEEYEECARLLKLKNETPYSDEKTHFITKSGSKPSKK